jgi:hypothetical protein
MTEATGLGTSKNPCPYCGKKKWEMWYHFYDGLEDEFVKSYDVDEIPIVDWVDEIPIIDWIGFELDFYGLYKTVDVCLSCGAQIQG